MVRLKFFCVLIYEVLLLEMLKGFGGILNLLFVACGQVLSLEFIWDQVVCYQASFRC